MTKRGKSIVQIAFACIIQNYYMEVNHPVLSEYNTIYVVKYVISIIGSGKRCNNFQRQLLFFKQLCYNQECHIWWYL